MSRKGVPFGDVEVHTPDVNPDEPDLPEEAPPEPRRVLGDDGELKVVPRNLHGGIGRDVFYRTVQQPWSRLLGIATTAYVLAACTLGGLLQAIGGVRGLEDASYLDASLYVGLLLAGPGIEGIEPVSVGARVVVLAASLMGVVAFAMLTGLAFAKFTIPRAGIRISSVVLLTDYEGARCLLFRLANERPTPIIDARIRFFVARQHTTPEGVSVRRVTELVLERGEQALLAIASTIRHVLDDSSPLHGMDLEEIFADDADLMVCVHGAEGTFGQVVYALQSYRRGDVRVDAQFADMVTTHADGTRSIDFSRLDAVV